MRGRLARFLKIEGGLTKIRLRLINLPALDRCPAQLMNKEMDFCPWRDSLFDVMLFQTTAASVTSVCELDAFN